MTASTSLESTTRIARIASSLPANGVGDERRVGVCIHNGHRGNLQPARFGDSVDLAGWCR